jgi:hypothetical protein
MSELRGISTQYRNGGAWVLEGDAKLFDDVRRIALKTVKTWIGRVLSEADRGLLALEVSEQLENPANWWDGQPSPVILSEIVITATAVTQNKGIRVLSNEDTVTIKINYTERETGIRVDANSVEAIIVPFGAIGRG